MNYSNFRIKYKLLILFIIHFISVSSYSQVRLPRLISDGMVLQRNVPVKIWGWATDNEKITIGFMDSTYHLQADNNGNWSILLPKMKAGGPYTMQISASNKITINNILIGDVWVCSGQSNMELNMNRVSPLYGTEIANCENPKIRYFEVPDKYNFNAPQKNVASGQWKEPNPKSILSFSAVSYFFGKEINEKYKVPVGLINSALGGSPVESWISEDALREFPKYYDEAQKFKDSTLINKIREDDNTRIHSWYRLLRQKDVGYKDPKNLWTKPELNTADWETMKIPGYWTGNDLENVNGVVWFRKKFNVPSDMGGKKSKLLLGRIVDADSVFVNGRFVGTTSYQYPPRRYEIPERLLTEGENSIVVRVISNIGTGGFVPDKPYMIDTKKDTIDLKGEWKYRLGAKMDPLQSQTFIRWKPVGLYNAMIAPLLNVRIKGVIWYQGESNAEKPLEYASLFSAMIKDWRDRWEQGDFPFLFVQLPNFMEAKKQPSESNWALLREAQLKTLSVPNTAMAVTIDIGEWNDIHPLDKKDVGKRLALAAQKLAYGDDNVVYSGPIYKSMNINDNKIELSFTNVGSGLVAKGNGELKYFSIAGPDKKFVWAKARIVKGTSRGEYDKVVVWSDTIPNPVAVRYAWADNPESANLYNKEGLPASPFRTDNF